MTITREQLELAALAAGHRVYGWCVLCDDRIAYADIGPEESIAWRPHTDPGDAMRLLCSLKMNLRRTGDGWEASIPYLLPAVFCVPCDLTHEGSAAAAREAVTLCAAAVGERMREAK